MRSSVRPACSLRAHRCGGIWPARPCPPGRGNSATRSTDRQAATATVLLRRCVGDSPSRGGPSARRISAIWSGCATAASYLPTPRGPPGRASARRPGVRPACMHVSRRTAVLDQASLLALPPGAGGWESGPAGTSSVMAEDLFPVDDGVQAAAGRARGTATRTWWPAVSSPRARSSRQDSRESNPRVACGGRPCASVPPAPPSWSGAAGAQPGHCAGERVLDERSGQVRADAIAAAAACPILER